MEIIIVFLVCLLLLNLFKKSKVEDISEARLNEIRNLISNWYSSLHEFCKITEDHSKIIAKHEKDFKVIEEELKNFNRALDNFNLAMDMIPPTTNGTGTITTSSATSYSNPVITQINKKRLKKKFRIIKQKKEKKDDTNN